MNVCFRRRTRMNESERPRRRARALLSSWLWAIDFPPLSFFLSSLFLCPLFTNPGALSSVFCLLTITHSNNDRIVVDCFFIAIRAHVLLLCREMQSCIQRKSIWNARQTTHHDMLTKNSRTHLHVQAHAEHWRNTPPIDWIELSPKYRTIAAEADVYCSFSAIYRNMERITNSG